MQGERVLSVVHSVRAITTRRAVRMLVMVSNASREFELQFNKVEETIFAIVFGKY